MRRSADGCDSRTIGRENKSTGPALNSEAMHIMLVKARNPMKKQRLRTGKVKDKKESGGSIM